MAKKELKMRAVVVPTPTVVVSAYDENGKAVTVGSHTQITGEIKTILAEESILNDKGRILVDEWKPIIYDEEQVVYRSAGEIVADAFQPGAELKKTFRSGAHEG